MQSEYKKGASEIWAQKITQMLGFYPKTISEQPTILADSVVNNIESLFKTNIIKPQYKTLILFGIAVAQEDNFQKHKHILQAKLYGYTEEDLAYIAETVALLAKITTYDLLLSRSEEEMKNYEENLQNCLEYLKKILNLPNSYDKSKIQRPKSNLFGLSTENEAKAFKIYGNIPYNLNEMPTTYANYMMERLDYVFQYNQKFPLKERFMIFYAVVHRFLGGQSEPLKHYFSKFLRILSITKEEMADLAACVMMQTYQNIQIKYTEWDFEQYKKDWTLNSEIIKNSMENQQINEKK